jgi:hypothetical protein
MALRTSLACAQDEIDPAGYRETIEEAVREFGEGNFEEARALFARAHTLLPSARTSRGVGMADFELRNYVEAIEQLELALHSTTQPLDDSMRADTQDLLTRAYTFVGKVVLDARPLPSNITVDALPVDLREGNVLLLKAGEHALELEAPGFITERRRLRATGGETQTVTVVFQRTPAPFTPEKRTLLKNPWFWTAVGVVAVGAATSIALGVRSSKHETTFDGGTSGVVLGKK